MDEAGAQVYRAYMLRLRRTDGTHPAWRASLQEVATGERHTFASLDETVAWLREQIGETVQEPAAPRDGEARPNATYGERAAGEQDDGRRATNNLRDQ